MSRPAVACGELVDIHVERLLAGGTDGKPCLLARLAKCRVEERLILCLDVATGLEPTVELTVPDEEGSRSRRIDNKRGGSEMRIWLLAGERVVELAREPLHPVEMRCLLGVGGNVRDEEIA